MNEYWSNHQNLFPSNFGENKTGKWIWARMLPEICIFRFHDNTPRNFFTCTTHFNTSNLTDSQQLRDIRLTQRLLPTFTSKTRWRHRIFWRLFFKIWGCTHSVYKCYCALASDCSIHFMELTKFYKFKIWDGWMPYVKSTPLLNNWWIMTTLIAKNND